MESDKLIYHPLIEPYANAFASIWGGIVGWRFLKPEEFDVLRFRGVNDRIALASEGLQKQANITFSLNGSIRPLVDGSVDHIRLGSLICQQLVGHCWEILNENALIPCPEKAGPLLEFFRHIRNGAYHRNRFYFDNKKQAPPFPAKWRKLEITATLQGHRVFRDNLKEQDFFLNFGDPLYLLADVSKLI